MADYEAFHFDYTGQQAVIQGYVGYSQQDIERRMAPNGHFNHRLLIAFSANSILPGQAEQLGHIEVLTDTTIDKRQVGEHLREAITALDSMLLEHALSPSTVVLGAKLQSSKPVDFLVTDLMEEFQGRYLASGAVTPDFAP